MGQLICWSDRPACTLAAPLVPPATGRRCSAGGKGWRRIAADGSLRALPSQINARMPLITAALSNCLPNQNLQNAVLARACCL
jgi:hypothetical protein